MKYDGEVAHGLIDELLEVVQKYEDTMLIPTIIGCLDIVKTQILMECLMNEDDSDDEEN